MFECLLNAGRLRVVTSSLVNLFQCPTNLPNEKFFLIAPLNFVKYNYKLFPCGYQRDEFSTSLSTLLSEEALNSKGTHQPPPLQPEQIQYP